MNADAKPRCKAFIDSYVKQHAQEIETATVALLNGQTVRFAYDKDTQQVTCTPINNVRETP